MSPSCPEPAELVTLLHGPAVAELQDHVAACRTCQAELALLRQGYAALAALPGPSAEPELQRIAARVLPPILADLAIASQPATADPAPPRRSPAPGWRQLLWPGAVATLAVLPAVLLWVQLGDPLQEPARALGLLLLPLWLLPTLAGSPRQRAVALILASTLTVGLMLSTVAGTAVALARGSGCLLLALSGSLLPALVMLRATGPQRAGLLSGALLGAAIGSGGAALQRLSCGIGGLPHALVFHLGPFFLLIALFGLWGSRAARDVSPSR